ncbi:MAG: YcxB family protein [Firmicutes bacterium]|nr:YcxB family protein [Bacillota bacterium]
MNYLYQTTTKYNFEEFKKYTWVLINKKRLIISLCIIEAACVFLAIFWDNPFFYAFGAVYPLMLIGMQNRRIKKVWESNKLAHDRENIFEFYEDYFIVHTPNAEAKIEYSQLHRIIDSPTNMYLMLAANQGYPLIKANFPEGLEAFLKSKQ